MIAQLLQKNSIFVCSKCRMKQPNIRPKCIFCDAIFSNYENIIIKNYNDEE